MANFYKHLMLVVALMASIHSASAQFGPVGFVNFNDQQNGITGGMDGQLVVVDNRQDLARYASAPEPYTIIVEGTLTGEGLNRKKDNISVTSNKTIIGRKGATLAGIGLDIQHQQNIIIRNLTIHHADPDAIACRASHHIWVDHCDVYSEDEPVKEDWDGLIDLTLGSSYLTVSYCYVHDHHKACLLNGGTMHYEDAGRNRATYHHNAFLRTDQRNPRIGYGLAHVFSNYYQQIGTYAIGYHTQARVFSENNYFGSGVAHPFSQMYAQSTIEASCGFSTDRSSHFSAPLSPEFKYQPTGTDFDPSWWYDYQFALTPAERVSTLYPQQVGPVEGLEFEPILWPGNGATDILPTEQLKYSTIEGSRQADVFLGLSPAGMQRVDLSSVSLRPATTYYWQVVAQAADGRRHPSPIYRFTTASAKASHPYPHNGEQNAQLREVVGPREFAAPLLLRWRPAANAASYNLYLSTRPLTGRAGSLDGLDNTIAQTGLKGPEATARTPLRYGQTYYWRVDVVTADGQTVKGDQWTFSAPSRPVRVGRTELEHLARSAYAYLEHEDGKRFTASNDTMTVGEVGPGAMTGVWQGPEGDYRVRIGFHDEAVGQARMALTVNEVLVDEWRGERQHRPAVHEIAQPLHLKPGDQLRIDFHTQRRMRCRMDYIDVEPVK